MWPVRASSISEEGETKSKQPAEGSAEEVTLFHNTVANDYLKQFHR